MKYHAMLNPAAKEVVATVCFAAAIVHTFSVRSFHKFSRRYREGSAARTLFHHLGEIEVVFGIWAAILLIYLLFSESAQIAIEYLETRSFVEPIFVFVIMSICSTRPIL